MQLPGRLKTTTLGDLLGALHRESSTGTLELIEDRGRTHRVHLSLGRVVAVELDGAAPSLAEILRRDHAADDDVLRRSLLRAMTSRRLHGEVLVDEFHLAPSVVGAALRRQLLSRLTALEQLADARVSFRVAVRPPRGALHQAPLDPREFLHGRRRRARAPPHRRRCIPVVTRVPGASSAFPPGPTPPRSSGPTVASPAPSTPTFIPWPPTTNVASSKRASPRLTEAYRTLVA